MSKITYEIRPISSLMETDKKEMFALMQNAYKNVHWDNFIYDLKNKNHLIRLIDKQGNLCGFSTVQVFTSTYKNKIVNIIYSGDTIIAPEHWGTFQLPLAFGKIMQSIKEKDFRKLFWMLISKGFRTYRFLPVFFHEFYPSYNRQTPNDIQEFMNNLALSKFPSNYKNGIIIAEKNAQTLKSELDTREQHFRLNDPHIKFFLNANPGYYKGNELLCITEFNEYNITEFYRKRLQFTSDSCLL